MMMIMMMMMMMMMKMKMMIIYAKTSNPIKRLLQLKVNWFVIGGHLHNKTNFSMKNH